jgi:hypothetical protein
MAPKNSSTEARGPFRFRVSDSMEVPLRGHMLRLRLLEGTPSMKDLQPGRRIRAESPASEKREITIVGHSATGGIASQERLEKTRELDVVVSRSDAGTGPSRIDIGWMVTGPVG